MHVSNTFMPEKAFKGNALTQYFKKYRLEQIFLKTHMRWKRLFLLLFLLPALMYVSCGWKTGYKRV